jgi:hypothetical protein
MPNNFTQDSRIIDFWRFENNLAAGKAGNDLTPSAGGVGYESGSPLEGAYSLKLLGSLDQWAQRNDADLSAGFPLKNGDTVKTGTWLLRFKPASFTGIQYLLSKGYGNGQVLAGFNLYIDGGYLCLSWGYGSGSQINTWVICPFYSFAPVYHVGIAFDGVTKTAKVRVWDGSSAVTYNKTDWTDALNIGAAPFRVGSQGDPPLSEDFTGLVDEVVVADDILSDADIDLIRQGLFGPQEILLVGIPSAEAFGAPGILVEGWGYAAPQNVPGDLLTYIEALEISGEFIVMPDIEEMGTITLEAPADFSDLVGGDLSGLILNNRQEGLT